MTRLERSQRDDYALMEGVAASDEASLRSLIQRYSPTVIAICRRMLHSHTDAEDVAAEVFAELWFHRDRYDASRGAPRATFVCWLEVVALTSSGKSHRRSRTVLICFRNLSSIRIVHQKKSPNLPIRINWLWGRSLNCRCRSEKPSNLHFLVA